MLLARADVNSPSPLIRQRGVSLGRQASNGFCSLPRCCPDVLVEPRTLACSVPCHAMTRLDLHACGQRSHDDDRVADLTSEPRTCCSGRNTKSGKPQYVAAFLVACSAAGPDGTPAGRTVAGRIGRRNTPFDVSTTSVTDGSRTVGRLADVVVSKRPRRGVCSASEKRLDSDENFLNRPKHPIEIRQHQLPTDCGGRRPIHDSHRRRYGEDHFSGTGTIKP